LIEGKAVGKKAEIQEKSLPDLLLPILKTLQVLNVREAEGRLKLDFDQDIFFLFLVSFKYQRVG
jgi:hypothetical protein